MESELYIGTNKKLVHKKVDNFELVTLGWNVSMLYVLCSMFNVDYHVIAHTRGFGTSSLFKLNQNNIHDKKDERTMIERMQHNGT
jgi:hypothetical protein